MLPILFSVYLLYSFIYSIFSVDPAALYSLYIWAVHRFDPDVFFSHLLSSQGSRGPCFVKWVEMQIKCSCLLQITNLCPNTGPQGTHTWALVMWSESALGGFIKCSTQQKIIRPQEVDCYLLCSHLGSVWATWSCSFKTCIGSVSQTWIKASLAS